MSGPNGTYHNGHEVFVLCGSCAEGWLVCDKAYRKLNSVKRKLLATNPRFDCRRSLRDRAHMLDVLLVLQRIEGQRETGQEGCGQEERMI